MGISACDRRSVAIVGRQLRHLFPGRRTSCSVAICDVGNELEGKLAGIEASLQDAVALAALHGLLDHDACLQDFAEQSGQHAGPDVRCGECHPIGCYQNVPDTRRQCICLCVVPTIEPGEGADSHSEEPARTRTRG